MRRINLSHYVYDIIDLALCPTFAVQHERAKQMR
jgi:hypothetical protein